VYRNIFSLTEKGGCHAGVPSMHGYSPSFRSF
jgi:hypothetical protein